MMVEFSKLTSEQKAEVYAMYPPASWTAGPYEWYRFHIKPDGHLTRAKGRHELTEHGYQAWHAQMFGHLAHRPRADKGDLDAWKPGTTFHFSRD